MDGEEHCALCLGMDIVRDIRVENQQIPGGQRMFVPLHADQEMPLERVNGYQPRSRVAIQPPPFIEGKEDMRHRGAMKNGDLTMPILGIVRLSTKCSESLPEIEEVPVTRKPFRGWGSEPIFR